MNIGVAMAGGNNKATRKENDFYPTADAWNVVTALIRADNNILSSIDGIWEPACGDGAISNVLIQHGFNVKSTDLIDRGYGDTGIDFLKTKNPLADAMITNPPFNLAKQFITHALFDLDIPYLALLLKATFWHASTRHRIFEKRRPSHIYPLTWRIDFSGGGSPTMECAWFVWQKGFAGLPSYYPLLRPTEMGF
jgi:hypothetical protein